MRGAGAPRRPRNCSNAFDDRRLAAKEDAGVLGIERPQAPIRRALRIAVGRPGEVTCVEPRLLQASTQVIEPPASERDGGCPVPGRQLDRDLTVEGAGRQIGKLPFRRQLGGQVGQGRWRDDDAEDAFVEAFRQQEFGETPLGRHPIG